MKKLIISLSLLSLIIQNTIAQTSVYLDTSFGVGGRQSPSLTGTIGICEIKVDANDNIFTGCNRGGGFLITKNTPNGAIDNTFGTQGAVSTNFSSENNDNLSSIAVLGSGQIIAGGYSTSNGVTKIALAKYNTNGSLDNTFGTNGTIVSTIGAYSKIYSIAVQSDGKIIAAGVTKSTTTAASASLLTRFNANGDLDLTFGNMGIDTFHINTSSNDSIVSVAIQTDGKIVAGGQGANASSRQMFILRTDGAGLLDNGFGVNGISVYSNGISFTSIVKQLIVMPNNNIMAADYITLGSGPSTRSRVKKFLSSGIMDTTYGGQYGVIIDFHPTEAPFYSRENRVNTLAPTNDGGIIVGGSTSYSGSNIALAKIKPDGTLDLSFGNQGTIVEQPVVGNISREVKSLTLQSSNKIVTGSIQYNTFELERFQNIVTIPLSINLLTFNATPQKNSITLIWIIGSNADLGSFILQRSKDGTHFEDIASIQKGSSAEYNYQDNNLDAGRYYYRLKLIEASGVINYSNIEQAVINGIQNNIVLFPNPVTEKGNFNIKLTSNAYQTYQFVITDINGKILISIAKDIQKGEQVIPIDIHSLSKGNYTIDIISDNGTKKISTQIFTIK